MERHYDCEACQNKNCNICPACGRNPSMRDKDGNFIRIPYKISIFVSLFNYRNSVKNGYYSSSIIEKRDKDGNFIGYAYNKPGE